MFFDILTRNFVPIDISTWSTIPRGITKKAPDSPRSAEPFFFMAYVINIQGSA